MDGPRLHLSHPDRADCIAADSDRLLIDLTAARIILDRARGELLSRATIVNGYAQASMRSVAIDMETAGVKIAAAIERRRSEL